VQHLTARSLEVEIWNADSAMQVGTVEVPLEHLVRQGRPVTKVEGEHPVLDPMTGEARGLLRLLLVCRGRDPAPQGPLPTAPLQQLAAVPQQDVGGGADRRRGRSRHKARALLEVGGAALAGSLNDPDADKKRQRLKHLNRIRRIDDQDRFSQHTALLSAAEEVRQDQKKAEVARRMDRFNTSQVTVPAQFATPSYFHIEFTNPYHQQVTFTVVIAERGATPQVVDAASPPPAPLHGVLTPPPGLALQLVRDRSEWLRLSQLQKVPPPPRGDYGFLSGGVGGVIFTLQVRETVSLPFRYLAFDQPGPASGEVGSPVSSASLADLTRLANTQDRTFVVELLQHQGPLLQRIEVTARPRACPVDRTVRFFEAEGTPVEKSMALPERPVSLARVEQQRADDGITPSPAGERYVHCTNRDVHVQRADEDRVVVRLLAPEAPQVLAFFLVFYGDPYFSEVLAAQLVEVHGLMEEKVRVTVGLSVDRTLHLPPMQVQNAGALQVHSSAPDYLALQAATLDPRYGAKFTVTVTAMRVGTSLARIHAVDPATRRRASALLLVLVADPPQVSHAPHEIVLPVLTAKRKWLPFRNAVTRALRYTVRSSDTSMVTVQTPELALSALEERHIELLFHACPTTLTYSAQVYLFVTSEDRAVQETRQLNLTYT
jgi:hypothetical protein